MSNKETKDYDGVGFEWGLTRQTRQNGQGARAAHSPVQRAHRFADGGEFYPCPCPLRMHGGGSVTD
jgi:hypothetical protein